MDASPAAEVVEYTDPGCSWAWGSEPKLRLLRSRHGHRLEWRRVQGGLVGDMARYGEDFDPEKAAPDFRAYWRHVADTTGMPHPGRLRWMYRSTEPSCLAAKAAERQGRAAAEAVLRRLREATFVLGVPPDEPRRVLAAVTGLPGVDAERLVADLDDPAVRAAFAADWEETRAPNEAARALDEEGEGEGAGGVRRSEGHERYVFPTLVFRGPGGERTVSGWKPFDAYVEALEDASPGATSDPRPDPAPDEALRHWGSLAAAELAALCGPAAGPPAGAVAVDLGGGTVWYAPSHAPRVEAPR